jgi:hypothetical protein
MNKKKLSLDDEFKVIETEPVTYEYSEIRVDDHYVFKTRSGNEYIFILKKKLIQNTSEINLEMDGKSLNMFDIIGKKSTYSLILSFATKKDYENVNCENPFKVITNNKEYFELVADIIFLTKEYLSKEQFEVLMYYPSGNNIRESKVKNSLFLAFIKHQMKNFNAYSHIDTGYTYLIKKHI